MVRLLVSLKLRLLRRGVQVAGGRAVFGLILSVLFAVTAGGLAGLGLLGLRGVDTERAAGDLLAIACALLFITWSVGPLITGSESTLDPDRLVLLPLPARRLMPGLLAAGAVGFGGLATLLTSAGIVVGMAPASLAALVTVVATASLFAVCVATSRVIATAMSVAARKRRLRDVALFAGPMAGIVLSLLFQLVPRAMTGDDGSIDSTKVPGALRYASRLLPSGPPAMAIDAVRTGDAAVVVASLALTAATLVLLLVAWSRLLERVLTTASESSVSSSRRRRSLLGGAYSFLPATRFGAVLAKDLRLTWRDPRQRVALLGALLPAIFPLLGFVASDAGEPRPALVLFAVVPVFMLGASGTNLYGYDGPAHWTDVAAGADGAARTDLAAKAMARVVIMVPLFVVSVVALSVVGESWSHVPVTVGVAIGAAGVTLGAAVLGSIRAPLPMPDTPTNPFSTGNAGQGMAVAGAGCVTLLATGAVIAPFAAVAAVAGNEPLVALVTGGLAIATGFAAWQLGLTSAARQATERGPELLAALETSR